MTTQSFFFVFIPILASILLIINILLAPHNPYEEKNSVFECGFHSFLGQNRSEFNISFYVFGLAFLIFDIDIMLSYPYVVSAYTTGAGGLSILLIFFIALTIGFAYELGKGALSIDSRQNDILEDNNDTTTFNDITYKNSLLRQNIIFSHNDRFQIIHPDFYNVNKKFFSSTAFLNTNEADSDNESDDSEGYITTQSGKKIPYVTEETTLEVADKINTIIAEAEDAVIKAKGTVPIDDSTVSKAVAEAQKVYDDYVERIDEVHRANAENNAADKIADLNTLKAKESIPNVSTTEERKDIEDYYARVGKENIEGTIDLNKMFNGNINSESIQKRTIWDNNEQSVNIDEEVPESSKEGPGKGKGGPEGGQGGSEGGQAESSKKRDREDSNEQEDLIQQQRAKRVVQDSSDILPEYDPFDPFVGGD